MTQVALKAIINVLSLNPRTTLSPVHVQKLDLLGDLAVCSGDITATVVNVASYHIVSEVRFHDYVFGVHLNLQEQTDQVSF